MSEATPETILNKIVAVLEEHNAIFLSHRQNFEHLSRELERVKRRLDKLEAGNSLNSNDAQFVAEANTRLKAISDTLRERA